MHTIVNVLNATELHIKTAKTVNFTFFFFYHTHS